ncbi:pancreatic triacylglycerol lipase-like [Trichoplusia ni]|uniref:Pancreatic triacylglycerol lipase-like n=1 Tax=Trichoplusia ni TaxID=7111 RepID=A0A7E5VK26_TRINI|nr:pancreatic triacylglycerol lipase-like [Trichoplusia ni]
MSKFFTFMAAVLASLAPAQPGLIGNLISGIANDVGTIKHVVDKTLFGIGSSQCSNVKWILGFSKDNYDGSEPNMEELTLDFITNEVNFEYKLIAAAANLPNNPFFNSSRPIYFYFHGFTDDPNKQSYANIGQAFVSQGNYNVVALDASSLIRFLYLRASTVVEFIGIEVAKVLATLYENGLAPEDIHLIGHSLGAHIAGFAGKKFHDLTGKLVGQIAGLDPAGPCFSELENDRRLSKDHAEFVFVMHTDSGVYGLDEQIGHADFYPNGGYQQPNCVFQTCSHSRAWQFYAESIINMTAFVGVSCPDYESFRDGKCNYGNTNYMGFLTSPCAEGKFYLETNDKAPFGLGKEGVVYGDNRGALTKIINKLGILKK